jgi:hypothetical protein
MVDAPESDAARVARPLIRRPQLWVTAVTAVILVVATLGVLHLTARPTAVPAHRDTLSDPLAQITDPASGDFVDASPLVLLTTSGIGSATASMDVPPGVTSVRPYIRCAPLASFRITVGKGFSTGCDARSADFADIPVKAGRQSISVRIPDDVTWRLVVIATPDDSTTTSSTLEVTTGPDAILDPLDEIENPASTDYVAADVTPILHETGEGSARFTLDVPKEVAAVRVYLVCAEGARWSLDGTSGTCRGRINAYEEEPTSQLRPSLRVTVPKGTRFWLLVIAAPGAGN